MRKLSIELTTEEYDRFAMIAKKQRRTPENLLLFWADQLLRQDEEYDRALREGVREERVE